MRVREETLAIVRLWFDFALLAGEQKISLISVSREATAYMVLGNADFFRLQDRETL